MAISFGVRHSAAVSPCERRTVLLPGGLAGARYRAEYRVSTCPLVHADRSRIVWARASLISVVKRGTLRRGAIGSEDGQCHRSRNSRQWVHGPTRSPFSL